MALTIPLAHDFSCAWCWVGLHQARKLQAEFGVHIDWRSFEIHPEGMPWPDPVERPAGPSRFEMLLWADQMTMPSIERKKRIRTHKAHEAVQFARTFGSEDLLVEAIYRAYWEQGRDIDDVEVLLEIAASFVADLEGLHRAVETREFASQIVAFDEEAYSLGVTHVPTFFVGNDRLAEQPYQVVRKAVSEAVRMGESGLYSFLQLPKPGEERPYTLVNMVSTLDGRIVSGDRDDSVQDLGSKVDHMIMKRIEGQVDAVMLGAHTLRVTSPRWDPKAQHRIVVSRSGDLPWESSFLTSGRATVLTTRSSDVRPPNANVRVLRSAGEWVDFQQLMHGLRAEGVKRLLVLGGSKLNGQLFADELVDELFLTLAPKLKLGRDLPNIAEGEPFPREALPRYQLLENHTIGDEVFLRYRRSKG